MKNEKLKTKAMALAICVVICVVCFIGTVSAEIIGGGDATTSEKETLKGVGDVVFSFTGPDSGAAGLTWDGTNLWLADIWSGNIYKIDPSDGSVISSFTAPTSYPTSLAWDGTNLWVVCEQAATAYKLDPSDGSIISAIHLPGYGESDPNSACITWDGAYLWHADYTHNKIYKLDPSDGSVVSSFASPGSGPSGLTWDGTHLWHSDPGADTIYKLDPSDGSVVLSFTAPASHPWDLAWDGAYLWNADIDANTVYKIDVETPCVIETAAYGTPLHKGTIDALILNPLRELRDDNLKDEYVDRYYDYSPELTMVLTRDSALTFKAARLLVKYSPMVWYQVYGIGVDKLITRRDVGEIVSFTDRLERGVLKNRDEIGAERSQEILKFLDEFKGQVKASDGKTFSEALQDSIYYKDEQMPDGDH